MISNDQNMTRLFDLRFRRFVHVGFVAGAMTLLAGCAADIEESSGDETETPSVSPTVTPDSEMETETESVSAVQQLEGLVHTFQSVSAVCTPQKKVTWYLDHDSDRHGDPAYTVKACTAPTGYVNIGDDCNDSVNTIYPGAPETCNKIDDDCDKTVDEGLPVTTWYVDADKDGYGSTSSTKSDCQQPSGYVSKAGDCNDSNASIKPGAAEVYCDGIDNDCSGSAYCSVTAKVSGNIHMVDYDWDSADEHGDLPVNGSATLSTSSSTATLVDTRGCADEVTVRALVTAALNNSYGQVKYTLHVWLYEGTGCGDYDLDGEGLWTITVDKGKSTPFTATVWNTAEGEEDRAEVSLTFSN